MGGSHPGIPSLRNQAVASRSADQQARRAWALVGVGFVLLLGLLAAAGLLARWYLMTATTSRSATVQVVHGSGIMVRSPGEADWRVVTQWTQIHEGDTIATGPGAVGWLTLFDRGTIEISEDSELAVKRMRTTRYLGRTKEFVFEPLRGTIYIGMAPHGDYQESSIEVISGGTRATMRDSAQVEEAGSFLVEVQRVSRTGGDDDPLLAVRVGVLRGEADVESDLGHRRLGADQQAVISATGAIGPTTAAVREMVRNGDFSRGMTDWVEYQDQSDDGGSVYGTVQRVQSTINDSQQIAVEFARGGGATDYCETGIQQTIGFTMRVYSSLRLSADIWIDDQQMVKGESHADAYPLILRLNYVDLQGQAREWWHGFSIQPIENSGDSGNQSTLVQRAVWRHVEFDLRNITPLPREISSVMAYSTGSEFRARVANISLTSSETGDQS